MWDIRVIIPQKLQERVLQELHQSHPGIVRMKTIVQSYFWWPKLDRDIEHLTKSRLQCQSMKNAPPVAPLHPWIWPSKPWQQIHIDFAGLFKGKSFLIIVDAHSKWLEVIEMRSMTSLATIQELRRLFSSFSLPEQLVSDNGPQFTSEEFASFLKGNVIKHIRSAPYHPSSNGAAECFVRTFKREMTTDEGPRLTFQQQLMNFFLTYRITPHATTNVAPSTLLLKRHVQTRFDLLHPEVEETVAFKQAQQKWSRDQHSQGRVLFVGQRVMVLNFLQGLRWIPGTIVKHKEPLSYLMQISEGRIWHRHIDHLRETGDSPQTPIPEPVIPESVIPQMDNSPKMEEICLPVEPAPKELDIPVESQITPERSSSPTVQSRQEAAHDPPSPNFLSSPSPPRSSTRRYPQSNRRKTARFYEIYA